MAFEKHIFKLQPAYKKTREQDSRKAEEDK